MKKLSPITRYWPKSLAGQLITVLLFALVAAQIASLLILHDDRRLAFLFSAQQDVLSRTASVVQLLNKSEPALHQTIVRAASSRRLRFRLENTSAVEADEDVEGFDRFLQSRLVSALADKTAVVRVAVQEDDDEDEDEDEDDEDDEAEDHDDNHMREGAGAWPKHMGWFKSWREDRNRRMRFGRRHRGPVSSMTISVKTISAEDDVWLNVYNRVPPTGPAVAIPSLVTIAIMAVLLVIVVIFMVRRVTRPLAELAENAERLGRGEDVSELTEKGPEDIRKASRAFNQMQDRLTRFVRDRTLMLAAITHDLRTPITSLRIRAEMLEEGENRNRILETLAEMQALTDATLEFARQDAEEEPTRNVDILALVDAVCADLTDLGQDVSFNSNNMERLPYSCHPNALKRVIRNLVENAVRYGDKARVGISTQGDSLCIFVEDSGPGIAAEDRERIFEPFVRLENSRNRETGGIGLGLAISRTIVRAHGGDITVGDIKVGSGETKGSIFTVTLPIQPVSP
jgi:signal transduction histidine kinase